MCNGLKRINRHHSSSSYWKPDNLSNINLVKRWLPLTTVETSTSLTVSICSSFLCQCHEFANPHVLSPFYTDKISLTTFPWRGKSTRVDEKKWQLFLAKSHSLKKIVVPIFQQVLTTSEECGAWPCWRPTRNVVNFLMRARLKKQNPMGGILRSKSGHMPIEA